MIKKSKRLADFTQLQLKEVTIELVDTHEHCAMNIELESNTFETRRFEIPVRIAVWSAYKFIEYYSSFQGNMDTL